MKTLLLSLFGLGVLASTAPAQTNPAVTVNGQPAGKLDRLLVDGAITRHSIRGRWYEREVAFDAALLKPGANVLTLTIPAGPANNGMIYDCLRLELDESIL